MPIRPTSDIAQEQKHIPLNALVPGTVPWLLGVAGDNLAPAWLMRDWRGCGARGRPAWNALTLVAFVILRWTSDGMSRRAAVARAQTDMLWRAAMRLALQGPTPSETTLRRFETWLIETDPKTGLPRYLLLHEHFLHVARWAVQGAGRASVWAMDSTPLYAFGATLDTVRLLGDGLRRLGRMWAHATRKTKRDVAKEWKLLLLLAKSTKGHLSIDWRDRDERARVVTELAATVLRIVDQVRTGIQAGDIAASAATPLLALCEVLLQVVEQDLETDDQGRLIVARRVAEDRILSLTDPDARHGRKSRSQTYNGFKINVLGDVVLGLIAAVSVTAGNGHDAAPGHALIGEARRMGLEIQTVLADTAYGSAQSRIDLRTRYGVLLIAPPPPVSPRDGSAISKNEFAVDFAAGSSTCPAGITTTRMERVGNEGDTHIRFRWDRETCMACPLATRCLTKRERPTSSAPSTSDAVAPSPDDVAAEPAPAEASVPAHPSAPPPPRPGRPPTRGRVVDLHPQEEELRTARKAWEDPDLRAVYRQRSQVERLIYQVVRHGGRRARAPGLAAATLQVHAIAMCCNLQILAQHLASLLDKRRTRQAV